MSAKENICRERALFDKEFEAAAGDTKKKQENMLNLAAALKKAFQIDIKEVPRTKTHLQYND